LSNTPKVMMNGTIHLRLLLMGGRSLERPGAWNGLVPGTAWCLERPGAWNGLVPGTARCLERPGPRNSPVRGQALAWCVFYHRTDDEITKQRLVPGEPLPPVARTSPRLRGHEIP
jgi:hypothetical protein